MLETKHDCNTCLLQMLPRFSLVAILTLYPLPSLHDYPEPIRCHENTVDIECQIVKITFQKYKNVKPISMGSTTSLHSAAFRWEEILWPP